MPIVGWYRLARSTATSAISSRCWLSAGESDQLCLIVGVVRYGDFRAVVAALAQHLVERLHADEHLADDDWVESLVLACGSGEVPGVDQHIAGHDHADRVLDRHLPWRPDVELARRDLGIVERGLQGRGKGVPCSERISVD